MSNKRSHIKDLQLSGAALFEYAWPFSGHKVFMNWQRALIFLVPIRKVVAYKSEGNEEQSNFIVWWDNPMDKQPKMSVYVTFRDVGQKEESRKNFQQQIHANTWF